MIYLSSSKPKGRPKKIQSQTIAPRLTPIEKLYAIRRINKKQKEASDMFKHIMINAYSAMNCPGLSQQSRTSHSKKEINISIQLWKKILCQIEQKFGRATIDLLKTIIIDEQECTQLMIDSSVSMQIKRFVKALDLIHEILHTPELHTSIN